jgi:2-phospho-L-lactate/phosphoenolpyruvate guanylyltransferase
MSAPGHLPLGPSGLLQCSVVRNADDIAVLVPVKSFRAAKARLAGRVDAASRSNLARWMAGRVVAASHPLPVFVACDDDEVAEWADGVGASVLWSPGLGLNGAVDEGVATIAGKGFEHVVISHGDLPLATTLVDVARPGAVVLVPDRRRDGTNVLARPTDIVLPATYGAGSFRHHLGYALSAGVPVMVRVDARLSLDLDTVDDLRHPMVWPHVQGLVELDQLDRGDQLDQLDRGGSSPS